MTNASTSPVACLNGIHQEPRHFTPTEAALVAKALSNPTRIQILELFHTRCPRTAGDIVAEIPLAQSTVSAHLRILSDAGVIRTFRSGIRIWHCLNRSVIEGLADSITALARRPHST